MVLLLLCFITSYCKVPILLNVSPCDCYYPSGVICVICGRHLERRSSALGWGRAVDVYVFECVDGAGLLLAA